MTPQSGHPGSASLVTGGGSGIGRAICLALAARGPVAVLDQNETAAADTARLIRSTGGAAIALKGDVADFSAVAEAFDVFETRYGSPDTVVACAGVERVGNILEEPEADWDLVMAVNAKGVYNTARGAFERFTRDKRGSFIAIASDAGVTGTDGFAIYTASKFAVVGLIKCLALDFGHLGIRSNAICPSTVRTPMLEEYLANVPGGDTLWSSRVPMGRLAEPEEVAAIASFLASQEAAYINGNVYLVDGGSTAGRWPPLA